MSLLVWIVSNAVAAPPTNFGCNNPPCLVAVLSSDHHIVPPDRLRVVEAAIAPTRLEWFELTLTLRAGEVEVSIDGVYLDPRAGVEDTRAGTVQWVIPARYTGDGIDVEVFNPSSRVGAEYQLNGLVLVEHR